MSVKIDTPDVLRKLKKGDTICQNLIEGLQRYQIHSINDTQVIIIRDGDEASLRVFPTSLLLKGWSWEKKNEDAPN